MTARPIDIDNGNAAFVIRFLERRATSDPALAAALAEAQEAADVDAGAKRCEICGDVIVVEARAPRQRRTSTRYWAHRGALDRNGQWDVSLAQKYEDEEGWDGHDPQPIDAVRGVDYDIDPTPDKES